ncbi:hypothetical protein [Streptococcus suis]|uniref:hypothetical protein n=1 Tax=Streptococcus suis TaxID=1307 RepID=UPI003B9E4B92
MGINRIFEGATINGKKYKTLSEIANDFGLVESTLRNRYHAGLRDGGLLYHKKTKYKKFPGVEIQGRFYEKISDIAKDFEISSKVIRDRYRKGVQGKELVAPVEFEISHRFAGATIQGIEYKSLSAISKAFDIPEITLRGRYKAGKRDDELVETYRASFPGVTIRGTFYSSIKEIAETFNLPVITLQQRYKKGARGEDLISTKRLYYKPRSTSKHKNVYYNKVKKCYVYHTMHKGKHYEWARKSFDDILSVKERVEASLKNDGAIPKILDPQANKDYIKLLPVGSVVGQWTILSVFKKQGRYYANCQCSCGKTKDVYCASLTSGQSTNCGHVLQSLMTTKDYQNHAHSMQHKRIEPNVNNKLRERYISLDKRGRYYVSLTRYGLIVRQYFYNLDEAIKFRDKLLDDIDKNDGKIPQHYPTKPRP